MPNKAKKKATKKKRATRKPAAAKKRPTREVNRQRTLAPRVAQDEEDDDDEIDELERQLAELAVSRRGAAGGPARSGNSPSTATKPN